MQPHCLRKHLFSNTAESRPISFNIIRKTSFKGVASPSGFMASPGVCDFYVRYPCGIYLGTQLYLHDFSNLCTQHDILITIIICDIYIAPLFSQIATLRRCTVLLPLTQTCFDPASISTPRGAYNPCCYFRPKGLLKHIAIMSCQILIFMDE